MTTNTPDQDTAAPKRGRRALPTAQLADPIIRGWKNGAAAVGKSESQFKRDVRVGLFPPPMYLGPNSVGWRASWIDDALKKRPRRGYHPVDEGEGNVVVPRPRGRQSRQQQTGEETLSL